MPHLNEIPGIGARDVELLDMAGIRDAKHLAEQQPEELWERVKKTNELLEICEETPSIATLADWTNLARQSFSQAIHEPRKAALASAVNYEGSSEVGEMLMNSPFAIPLSGKLLIEKQIKVSDIAPGILLNRYSGDLDVRIVNPEQPLTEVPQRRPLAAAEIGHKPQPAQFDPSSLKSITREKETAEQIPSVANRQDPDPTSLIRTPLDSTNHGVSPHSRRFIRGLLHPHPWYMRTAAMFTLLVIPLIPISVVSALLLLLSKVFPHPFSWVPEWLIALPIALPVIGIGYLISGLPGRCRICRQKLFVHISPHKHVKAHHLPVLGYVLPLCLHLLFFGWFRCSSCGTPIRLKK
ncbi:MAG: hypothetical protein RL346_2047 [Verrucomicrobiota bacterium]|jgi:hypothetical protein